MAERYIRPPLVGVEARSERAAVWRFRLLLLVLLAALVVGVIFLVRMIIAPSNEGPPTIGLPRTAAVQLR